MVRRRRAEAEAAFHIDAAFESRESSSSSGAAGGASGSSAGGPRPRRRHALPSAGAAVAGLAMLTTCCAQLGEPGILAEYFSPVPESCGAPGEGSSFALDGLLPNLTRKDRALNFADGLSFDLQACAFEIGPSGKQAYACREATALRRNFGVRWSGQIVVQTAGEYLFEMEYSDGARLIMGHDHICPGPTCGIRAEVMNLRPGDLDLASNPDNKLTFAKQCSECAVDNYVRCFVSRNGCEPFPLWMLEGDNGLNGTCSSGVRTIQGSRYLEEGEHPFKIEYFQRQGDAKFALRWKIPGSNALTPIPSSAFTFPMGAGLNAEVFSVPNLPQFLPPSSSHGGLIAGAKLLQTYADIMEDTSEGSAWSQSIENMGPVMVRWTGYLHLNAGGRYKFRIQSDDGARLTIGGRGMTGEMVLVDNDGIKENIASKEGSADLLPGKSPIRIEYLYSPGADGPYGDTGLPKPPHCLVFYQGPDTKGEELLISRNWGEKLHLTDLECSSRSWTRGGGLTQSRDCGGFCYDTAEALIGDYVCDDGITSPTNFYCQAFDFDNGDCVINTPEAKTTSRPPNPCLESCPAGNWKRKDCSACDVEQDGMCVGNTVPGCVEGPRDPPGICNYGRCCVAKFTNIEYWGSDCLAFGAFDNCSYALERLLNEVKSTPRSFASLASGKIEDFKPIRAQLMVDCEGANCAEITEDRVRNPFTGVETEAYVCPVQESADDGLACFEGPWAETDPDPLEECQNDSFKYNFCTNRKTRVGRPYQTCCSFLWLAASGNPYCRFVGLETGSCGQWLAAYKDSVSGLQHQRIESELVLKECGKDDGDLCNDPMDEEVGCPQFVIERPKQVEHLIPITIDKEDLLKQGGEAKGEGVPWVLIAIPAGGLILVCGSFYALVKYLKEPDHPPFHTRKAKIVQGDTFVEPKQDLDTKKGGSPGDHILDGVVYGSVPPRPFALKQILRAQRRQKGPRALRIDPALAVGDVTTAAFDGQLAVEATVKGMAIEDFRAAAEADGVVAPVSPLPMRAVAKALRDIAPKDEGPRTPSWHSSEGEEDREARRQGASKEQPEAAATLAGARAALQDAGAPAAPALADAATAIEDEGQDARGLGSSQQLAEQVPGQIVESQAFRAPPPPPLDTREDLLRTAGELARTQAAFLPPPKPGAVNVVEAMRLSTTAGAVVSAAPDSSAKRPAAAARMLRQGMTSGVPRVCT